ncbi:Uncharacterized protein FWK35_00033782, partial [Aphis craccivora]
MWPGTLEIECLQRKFLKYASFVLNIDCLPHDYTPVLVKLNLETLSSRRKKANLVFLSKLLSGEVDAPDMLGRINFNVPDANLRNFSPFRVPFCATNNLYNEPILHDRHKADKVLENRAWERYKAKDTPRKEKLVAYAVTNAMKAKRKMGMGCKGKRKHVTKNNSMLRIVLKINHFHGVFLRDSLPKKLHAIECGILNLDISSGDGSHWIAFHKNKDKVIYFDSFGDLLYTTIETNHMITPINTPSIQEIYQEYLVAHTSNERMMNWSTRASTLSQQINLEFNTLRILMSNHHIDNSIPIDESIIMMSLRDVYRLSRRITLNHTQYYILMQLLYWRRRLEEIEPIEYRKRLKVQWR